MPNYILAVNTAICKAWKICQKSRDCKWQLWECHSAGYWFHNINTVHAEDDRQDLLLAVQQRREKLGASNKSDLQTVYEPILMKRKTVKCRNQWRHHELNTSYWIFSLHFWAFSWLMLNRNIDFFGGIVYYLLVWHIWRLEESKKIKNIDVLNSRPSSENCTQI